MPLYYEVDAPVSARFARIVDDPTGADNRVLHLQLSEATIDVAYDGHKKGRVQTNGGFDPPISELYYRQRMYLHPDLGMLLTYPEDGDPWWLGIIVQEMRAGSPTRGDAHSFLMDIRLEPDFAHSELHLVAEGKKAGQATAWETVWLAGDDESAVPLGEWLTLEVGYRQGDCGTGRFVVVVWGEDQSEPRIVLNVTGWTFSPDSPQPVALNTWGGPQKIYASDNVLDHIRQGGGAAQIYFDDFEIGPGWPASWQPPASTGIVVVE